MKTQKRKLNVRLLRKIQRHILEEPRRFFMYGVSATGEPGKEFTAGSKYADDLARTVPSCGTAACIHGWTAILSGKTPAQARNLRFGWSIEKLGLSPKMEDSLFLAGDWPEPFQSRYLYASTPSRRAQIGAARIEHLIKTGE